MPSVAQCRFPRRQCKHMIPEVFPPESAFSRAVYAEIRPAIPRSQWPTDALTVTVTPAADGMSLEARFEGLPPAYAARASQIVRDAKVGLVLESPVAYLAAQVVRMRRWRDTFMFALLPLLFAIPLLAALGDAAMRLSMLLCAGDGLALLATHVALMRRRGTLVDNRFIAHIPTPGLRIRVPVGTPLHPQS